MSKLKLLNQLKKDFSDCKLCPELVKCRKNIVFGVGNPETAKFMIIGEAPGAKEDQLNEPFVGKSGQVLNKLLESVNLKREEVYITNTILCHPPKNRNPNKKELHNCRTRLNQQIKIIDPKIIVTLGNFSTRYMLESKEGITKLRGNIIEKNGIKILPTFHPAVLLYSGMNPKKVKIIENDLRKVADLIHRKTLNK